MNWKGTKDYLSKDEDVRAACYNQNGDYVADFDNPEYPDEEAGAHLELFIDAVHTIQECDKLPSELLAERNQLLDRLKAMCAYWEIGGGVQDSGHTQSKELINKIEHGK